MQVVGRRGPAQPLHELGAGDQHVAVGGHVPRDHRLVDDGADPQRDIDAVLHQIDPALGGVDRQLDVGVLLLEGAQQDPPGFEARRQRQPQAPLEPGLVAHHGLLAFGQGLDAAARVLVQPHAGLGQAGAARRTFEQLHLQRALELADAPAQGGQRNLHALRRRRQAAGLHHGHEHPRCVEVHSILPDMEGKLSDMRLPCQS
ncbi:hypothetical protein D3C71_1642430 [compost metagenome]